MPPATHWAALWRELVEKRAQSPDGSKPAPSSADPWENRAKDYAERVKRRWSRPDSSRDFIAAQLDPSATVLDIGAGTGAWAMMMAKHAASVTAIEPSAAMRAYLEANLAEQQVDNVRVVAGAWPQVSIAPHDYALCSHAMYGYPDFPGFVRQMIASIRRMCILILRAPDPGGIMATACRHLWGQPFDSPNFTIAYNSLLEMGIYPNVLMENTGLWEAQTSPDLDAALLEMKRSFRLAPDDPQHDAFLLDLLRERLTVRDGVCVWPREVRSALVYWPVNQSL